LVVGVADSGNVCQVIVCVGCAPYEFDAVHFIPLVD
jgi:hypothetical protein